MRNGSIGKQGRYRRRSSPTITSKILLQSKLDINFQADQRKNRRRSKRSILITHNKIIKKEPESQIEKERHLKNEFIRSITCTSKEMLWMTILLFISSIILIN